MVRPVDERVLLIGDARREVEAALSAAAPEVRVTAVNSVFDGIAELAAHAGNGSSYTTVIAAAEPIERRPEAAVRTLRSLAGNGRVILFGAPGLEPLSRRMLQHGCDDYLVTPASADDVEQVLGGSPMRLAQPASNGAPSHASHVGPDVPELAPFPLADVVLDTLIKHPHAPVDAAIQQVNQLVTGQMEFFYRPDTEAAPIPGDGQQMLAVHVHAGEGNAGMLYMVASEKDDYDAAHATLVHLSQLLGKLVVLQDRHNRLQKLAITDELTGVYNARYFKHFLNRILERAKRLHFPVTLLLFDIDDFKIYNDQYGHQVGDEILKQTAALMRRCTREHDLVARVGGDEFAVVFWDKEGPRQPREPKPGFISRGVPQTPLQIFARFKRLLDSDQFTALGASGKGVLGISAGLAVYPYEAQDADTLIGEADRALMQGAKRRNGKNCIYLVGSDDPLHAPEARE